MSKFLKSTLVLVLALIVLLLLLPGLMGLWVDQTIRHALHDLQQHGMSTYQVSDFHRGWFRSSMVIVDDGGHAMPIVINHGPLLYHHHISIGMAEAYPAHPIGHFQYHLNVLFKLHGGVDVVVENGEPIMTHRFQAEMIQYYIAIKDLKQLDQIHGHIQAKALVFEPAHTHAEYRIQSAWLNFNQAHGGDAPEAHDFLFDLSVKGVQADLGEQDLESTPYRVDVKALSFKRLHGQQVEQWLGLLSHDKVSSSNLWSQWLSSMIQADTTLLVQKASFHLLKSPKDRMQVDGDLKVTFADLPKAHDWLDVLFLSNKQLTLDAHDWQTKQVQLEEGALSFHQSSMDQTEWFANLQHLTLHFHESHKHPIASHETAIKPPIAATLTMGSMDVQVRTSREGAFTHQRARLHGSDWCMQGMHMPMFCIKQLSGLMSVDHENAMAADPKRYAQMKSAWLAAVTRWQSSAMAAVMNKKVPKDNVKVVDQSVKKEVPATPSLNVYYNEQTVIHSQLTMDTTLFDAKLQSSFQPLPDMGLLKAHLMVSHVRDAAIHQILEQGVQKGYVLKQGLQYDVPISKRGKTIWLNGKVLQTPKSSDKPKSVVKEKA